MTPASLTDPSRYLVYVLHFSRPVGTSLAQHYTGVTKNLERRLHEHAVGGKHGSAMARRARMDNISIALTFVVFPALHRVEQALKCTQVHRICPLCDHDPTTTLRHLGIEQNVTLWPMVPLRARFASRYAAFRPGDDDSKS